ncbi:hypothetical protein F7725_005303 [Dissostichus mawsoni]|uniref:Short coiled-coil protein n=1 Tax=Dissostichus mawsoni TaxID=36200 RepID=A0A7J5YUX1_DISMA|nr:hypothetical protein F7725_005303 [Dissostichus mawsoni]
MRVVREELVLTFLIRCSQDKGIDLLLHYASKWLSLLTVDSGSAALHTKQENELFIMNCDIDGDMENQVEMEEKTRLINQVLELQHTLEDLSARVDAVKEENLKLKSENQVLGQYIENLMSASSVFQTTDTKSKRK